MDLKLSRPGFKKVQVDNEVYSVKIPTLGDQKSLQKDVDQVGKESSEATNIMINWLDSLGFPKAVAESLSIDDITQVIELLSAKKKS